MVRLRLLVPALMLATALPLGSTSFAASAHNIQTGAHTSNPNDSAEDAAAKQERQEQQGAARAPWDALR